MPLTEAQIINRTLAYIARHELPTTIQSTTGRQNATLTILLAYEEELRRLHEETP